MGRRREPRTDANLRVQVWGTDANGKSFIQSARTLNISGQGAVLEGIGCRLRVGEILRIQCGEQKANFQVVWVGEAGTLKSTQIGVKCLVPDRCIWSVPAPQPEHDTYVVRHSSDRRTEPRQGTSLKVELREDGASAPMWATTEDVSLGGCFIKMLAPLKTGTRLEVRIWIGSEKIWSRGVVRTSEPGNGFGVEFTYMPDVDVRILKTYLDSLPTRSRPGKAGSTPC
jgi:PilZ domain